MATSTSISSPSTAPQSAELQEPIPQAAERQVVEHRPDPVVIEGPQLHRRKIARILGKRNVVDELHQLAD